jgi:hypothetical protein
LVEVSSGISRRNASGNRVPKNLSGRLVNPFRDISRVSRLNRHHERPNIGSCDKFNELVAVCRENVCLQAAQNRIGMSRRFTYCPPFPAVAGDPLKAVFCFALPRRNFTLLVSASALRSAIGSTPSAGALRAAKWSSRA